MIKKCAAGAIQRRMMAYLGALALLSTPMLTQAEETSGREALKVCADGNSMPFSNSDKEGFENKIAELFGKSMGLPVEFTFFPQRMGFIRNTLRNEIKPGEYKCDLVMGVPEKFELAATTQPYYRSTYVLAYIKGRGFDEIKKPEDIDKLTEEEIEEIEFGLFDRGPAQLWVFKHGLMGQATPYRSQPGSTKVNPGDIMQDLIDDKINMTIIWGPFAGWWAKKAEEQGVEIVTIPLMNDPDDPRMRFEFNISMAVRYGEKEWKQKVNNLIDKHQDEINKILEEYNIPTLPMDQEI